MEALLASSKAEQDARDKAASAEQATQDDTPSPKTADKPAGKPTAAPKKPSAPAKKPATGKPKAASSVAKAPGAKSAGKRPKPPATPGKAPAGKQPAANAKDSAEAQKPAPVKTPPAPQAPEQESPAGPLGERASSRRARDREVLRERRRLQEEVSQLTNHVPTVSPADDPEPLTRRQLRLQALAEQQKKDGASQPKQQPVKPKPKPAPDVNSPETNVMSVEEALAARRKNAPAPPVDPKLLREEDSEIDLEVLAHQREMAVRAATISRRAAERERIRQQNVKAGKEANSPDPFTGAMGNIREIEDQVARSGVSGPKTESVSLDLDAHGKVPVPKKTAGQGTKKPVSKPAVKPKPVSKPAVAETASKSAAKPKPAAAKPAPKPVAKTAGKAKVFPDKAKAAAAEAQPQASPIPAVKPAAAQGDVVDLPRVEATNAQGLQPLDAQTAGVRRANNMFLAMIAALAVGGIALVAGIIMMITN